MIYLETLINYWHELLIYIGVAGIIVTIYMIVVYNVNWHLTRRKESAIREKRK